MRSQPTFETLIRLIDDPDVDVFEHVRFELLRLKDDIKPQLLDLIDYRSHSQEYVDRIESLVRELNFQEVETEILKWCKSSDKNLLTGLFWITKIQFPELTQRDLLDLIHPIERKIWLEVNRRMTAFEVVKRLNTMWFENLEMQICHHSTATTFNTFINSAIEDRLGTPLSIGLIYSVIAQRLHLPIYAVNFPGKSLLAYIDEFRIHELIEPLGSGGVLFYLDFERKGQVVIRKELEDTLKNQGILETREYFEPCSHSSLLMLYIDEILLSLEKSEKEQTAAYFVRIKQRILDNC